MNHVVKYLALAAAIFLVSCSDTEDDNSSTSGGLSVNESCTPDAGQCSAGLTCLPYGRDADNNQTHRCGEECDTSEALVDQCSEGRDCHPYRSENFFDSPLLGVCANDGPKGLDEPCKWPAECADGLICSNELETPGSKNFDGTCRPTCDVTEPSEGCTPFDLENPDAYSFGYERNYAEINEDCSDSISCGNSAVCVTYGEEEICANVCDNPGSFCDDGSVCFELGGTSSINAICYTYGDNGESESCQGSAQCAPGLFCLESGSSDRCARYCLEDSDCGEGEACDSVNGVEGGVCRVDIGGQCINAGMCDNGRLCSTSIDPALSELFPDGFCTDECTADADCGPNGVCRTVSGVDVCLRSCESTTDCNFAFDEICFETTDCGNSASISACQDAVSGGPVCLPLQ